MPVSGTYVLSLSHHSPVITKNIPRLLKAIKITAPEQRIEKYPKTTEGDKKPLQSSGSKNIPRLMKQENIHFTGIRKNIPRLTKAKKVHGGQRHEEQDRPTTNNQASDLLVKCKAKRSKQRTSQPAELFTKGEP